MSEPMAPPMSDPEQARHMRSEEDGKVACMYCKAPWSQLRQIHGDPTKAVCHKRQSLLFGGKR